MGGPAAMSPASRVFSGASARRSALLVVGFAVLVGGGLLVSRDSGGESPESGASDADLAIFLDREISDEDLAALESKLDGHPEVGRVEYFDEGASRAEFERLFQECSVMLGWLEDNPDGLPTSFRVVPAEVCLETIQALIDEFAAEPGVQRVSSGSGRFDPQ